VIKSANVEAAPYDLDEILKMSDLDFESVFKDFESYGGVKPPATFNDALKLFMKQKKVTIEELADRVNLSSRTIQYMRNDEDCTPTIQHVVAICIGLHLMPSYSYQLLDLSGYSLKSSKQHKTYRFLLDTAYMHSVDECNEFLERVGVNKL